MSESAEIIKINETLINIAQGMYHFESSIALNKEHISVSRGFPTLIKKYKHSLEISEKCLDRLKSRYNKHLSLLKKI